MKSIIYWSTRSWQCVSWLYITHPLPWCSSNSSNSRIDVAIAFSFDRRMCRSMNLPLLEIQVVLNVVVFNLFLLLLIYVDTVCAPSSVKSDQVIMSRHFASLNITLEQQCRRSHDVKRNLSHYVLFYTSNIFIRIDTSNIATMTKCNWT